jgi:hypothetical protein
MEERPRRKRLNSRKPPGTTTEVQTISLKELGLPTWDYIVSVFFHTTAEEAAKAICHWIHTYDCSPFARELIREAIKLDGSVSKVKYVEDLFDCIYCCDSKRLADPNSEGWQECEHCKDKETKEL